MWARWPARGRRRGRHRLGLCRLCGQLLADGGEGDDYLGAPRLDLDSLDLEPAGAADQAAARNRDRDPYQHETAIPVEVDHLVQGSIRTDLVLDMNV